MKTDKVYCSFCGERFDDENVSDCRECGATYCYRCGDSHDRSCDEKYVLKNAEELQNRQDTVAAGAVISFYDLKECLAYFGGVIEAAGVIAEREMDQCQDRSTEERVSFSRIICSSYLYYLVTGENPGGASRNTVTEINNVFFKRQYPLLFSNATICMTVLMFSSEKSHTGFERVVIFSDNDKQMLAAFIKLFIDKAREEERWNSLLGDLERILGILGEE